MKDFTSKGLTAPPLQHPWLLLGGVTLVNGIVAFSALPTIWKGGLLVLGLGFAAVWTLWFYPPPRHGQDPTQWEFLSPFSKWVLLWVLLVAAFIRFTGLTNLSLWPLSDEAKSGFFSLALARDGSAQMLYDFSQLPPLFIWLQGIFFKVFGISLSTLWGFPALLSLLTVVVSYPAARTQFSRSLSLVFTSLMALSFWPLYAGRFSHPGSLLLLWEVMAFWIAGILGKAKGESEKRRAGLALGLWAGLGFYTFTSWPTVALVLTLWVFWRHRRATGFFLAGMGLAYLPLGVSWLRHAYGGYVQYVLAFHAGEAWGPQILRGFWDLSAMFWKSLVPANLFAYRPFLGGYLNPLLGACFFMGVLVFLRFNPLASIRFWSLAFLLFYLPGFLTGGVEMFRIIPILPLLLAGATLGITSFLGSLKTSWRWPVWGILGLLSVGMDSYHLFGVYHGVWATPRDNWFASKSVERLRAYEILEGIQEKAGSGYILSDLVPDLYDQSLTLAGYGFNIEQNPKLGSSPARWVALLTNVHYQPFLQKEFPQSRWFPLATDMGFADGGKTLGIIPLPCPQAEKLSDLVVADKAMGEIVPLVFENRDYRSRQPVLDRLYSLYPLFQGDRFLEACFWEKIAENQYGDRNYPAQVEALRDAIERGFPAAHLYNDLGTLYLRRSRFQEARKAFQKALACRPNLTSAGLGLELLEKAEKTGQKPQD